MSGSGRVKKATIRLERESPKVMIVTFSYAGKPSPMTVASVMRRSAARGFRSSHRPHGSGSTTDYSEGKNEEIWKVPQHLVRNRAGSIHNPVMHGDNGNHYSHAAVVRPGSHARLLVR